MNAEIFAVWLRRQGYRVIRTLSSYWYNAGPGVLQAFPYHWKIEPSEKAIKSLLLKNNAKNNFEWRNKLYRGHRVIRELHARF